MNKEILKSGPQEFIANNLNTDSLSVLLQKPQFDGITQQELLVQIEAKKKCQSKLPLWYQSPGIYYPKKIHIEQTSSEATATYKASIVSGNTLLDASGGLGVDSWYFAQKLPQLTHCEINPLLSSIAAHNFKVLGATNMTCLAQNGIDHLLQSKTVYDWVYLDPSRRDDAKGKVFLLQDCLPNVPAHLNSLFSKTNNLLIKTAPLLDIKQGLADLKWVKAIHVVALKNEVKELLWVLEKDFTGPVAIKTINLTATTAQFNFNLAEEEQASVSLSPPLGYLYEPNAAILKAGAFKVLGAQLGLKKLHLHSHLYTANTLLPNFPGRCFTVVDCMPANKKGLKPWKGKKANLSTRNFPDSVANIRKKYGIKDGGEAYLFFTTTMDQSKVALYCLKA